MATFWDIARGNATWTLSPQAPRRPWPGEAEKMIDEDADELEEDDFFTDEGDEDFDDDLEDELDDDTADDDADDDLDVDLDEDDEEL